MSIKDQELNDHGSYITDLEDVKDFLACIIQEDDTLDDVKFSIQVLTVALERLTK